ncbi:hypothetical protein PG988_005710 [Apiospora saccharicola]
MPATIEQQFNATTRFYQEPAKGDGSSSLSRTVDGKDQYLSPKKKSHRSAPPINTEHYEGFKIALEWEPSSKEAGFAIKCIRFDACFDAYRSAAKDPCGRADLNGALGLLRRRLRQRGNGADDVRRGDVINTANHDCAAAPQKFTKDTPRWQKKHTEGGTDYFYSIEWQGGCRTDVEEQDIHMLDGKTPYPNCWQ